MQEKEKVGKEEDCLYTLLRLEEITQQKLKIYSRLLTEAALAKDMETLAARHMERKEILSQLVFGKGKKKQKEGGMYEMNEGERGK